MAEQPAWCQTVDEVLQDQGSKLQTGLTAEEVQRRREKYGWNELEKEPATPLWKLVLAQFDDMLVKVRCLLIVQHNLINQAPAELLMHGHGNSNRSTADHQHDCILINESYCCNQNSCQPCTLPVPSAHCVLLHRFCC